MKNKIHNPIIALPKGELHIHLNGAISFDVVKQIFEDERIKIPEGFKIPEHLVRNSPSSLQDYLKPWEVLRLIPTKRANLKLLVESAFINLKKDNVKFVEFRNSVLYIALINDVTVDTALGWLVEDLEEFSAKYEIQAGLILSVPRGEYALDHFSAFIRAYKKLRKPKQVVGLDLSGNENIIVPEELGRQFANAKSELGLGVTIHAGETGNVENIISAINDFHADRIGHGTIAGRHPSVMEKIKLHNVCIEVCPISNRLTNAVKTGDYHPVKDFLKHDVPFVICSDNPEIHQLTITDDYVEFLKETGDTDYIENMFVLQKKYSFLFKNSNSKI